MKRFGYLFTFLCIVLLSACKEDEPVLIFHSHSGTYSIGGNKALVVTLDGVRMYPSEKSRLDFVRSA